MTHLSALASLALSVEVDTLATEELQSLLCGLHVGVGCFATENVQHDRRLAQSQVLLSNGQVENGPQVGVVLREWACFDCVVSRVVRSGCDFINEKGVVLLQEHFNTKDTLAPEAVDCLASKRLRFLVDVL